jgi:Cu(I)/Ag(I) efflux system membrane fusion protein
MKPTALWSLGLVALAGAGATGYWLGQTQHTAAPTSPTAAATSPAAGTPAKPKLQYYRNPMGLPDTSPVPKKDPMGMDYIPVYEGEAADEPAAANTVKISADKVQKLGVRTEAAQLRSLDATVRAAGRIEPDERRTAMVAPKFEGYVERLLVNATGQAVAKGQPLFEVYSPELVSAQREYAIAVRGADTLTGADSPAQQGMARLVESSLLRLKNWDISDEQIKALVATGATQRTLTLRSPVSGIVTEKKAVQGMRFMPGEALYQVTDLSAVWVVADVFEQDIAQVQLGATAQVRIDAYPDKTFTGKLTYVYPTLKAETRTVPVRVELANPGLLLKPGMFAQVEVATAAKAQVLTVPTSAVIDSGTRQVVLVSQGQGRFAPREVRLGARSDRYLEVRSGLQAGEEVVVAANFLIDAESNLQAALGGFGSTSNTAPALADSAQAASKSVASVGHHAEGTVDSVDAKANTITMNHGPVASLKWPAMTMEFQLANAALTKGLKPGSQVQFEFVERAPGEWVITAISGLKAGGSK